GIRDLTVTGVQTCALPISERDREEPLRLLRERLRYDRGHSSEGSDVLSPCRATCRHPTQPPLPGDAQRPRCRCREQAEADYQARSEERRVGKECRSRWGRE